MTRYFSLHFRTHGRSFPWRGPSVSSFHVLLAELLLRQTDAPRVSSVWIELAALAADPESLLALGEEKLYRIVQPLGLADQRTQALITCCDALISKYRGRVPRNPYKSIELPHVGLYATTAVACFAFNQRHPVVDGNVLRVLGRLTGQDFGRDNRRSAEAWHVAWAILPTRNFRQHNFGVLDFAAQVCTAHSPKCGECAMSSACDYFLKSAAL